MTLLLDKSSKPGTHAVVIGIGRYPWLVGGKAKPRFAQNDGMAQLTSPPASARAFATWLLETYENPEAPLVSLDLGGAIMAAATDMISYMDFGGHLAQEFQAYRASLGMPPDVLYFNNGLTVIDRAAWAKAELGERTLRFIEANPALCLRFEQSALNALLKGDVAKLSPRFNFMGDFMRLDLESEIRPNVYHFVNRPKPWQKGWIGERRFARAFKEWFAQSPWPDFPDIQPLEHEAPVNQDFRRRLLSFLKTQHFADGWRA